MAADSESPTMLMTWTEFVTFLNSALQDLVETEYAQVRYGDVGMAVKAMTVFTLPRPTTILSPPIWCSVTRAPISSR